MADGFESLVGGKGGGQAIELQMEISVMAPLCLVGSSLWSAEVVSSGDRASDGDLSSGPTLPGGFESLVGGSGGGQAIELQMETSVMAALWLVGSSLWSAGVVVVRR
ncbi:hypothetical protein RRG08_008354 [Elysia crispata]|uniref:Uncharacterized protein n=1 Tax=Elysia crispata TaxID=231223 RepID=A0AAE0YUS8_9GAST|nr:hypothetical protein RRG08_008354 [Elysia crispata]